MIKGDTGYREHKIQDESEVETEDTWEGRSQDEAKRAKHGAKSSPEQDERFQEKLSQANEILEYRMHPKSLSKRFSPLRKSLQAKANRTRQLIQRKTKTCTANKRESFNYMSASGTARHVVTKRKLVFLLTTRLPPNVREFVPPSRRRPGVPRSDPHTNSLNPVQTPRLRTPRQTHVASPRLSPVLLTNPL